MSINRLTAFKWLLTTAHFSKASFFEKIILVLKLFSLKTFMKTIGVNRPQDNECVLKNHFSYLSTKTYVVGTQKNCLNEMVLLSTQNTCLN